MTKYNDLPETELELFLPDASRAITTWTEYAFNSHFLTPTDGFSLTVEDPYLDPFKEDALVPGARVQLRVGGCTQATGFLDTVQRSASRSGGIIWTLEGRDVLGQAVDAQLDPRTQFKETQTLADLFRRVFTPFGWSTPAQFNIDAHKDTATKIGRLPPEPRPTAKAPREHKLAQVRPNPGEGAYAFAARVAKRAGMHIWASADGRLLNLGRPFFEQDANYTLIRRRGGAQNNILDATARFDATEQPSWVVAEGYSGGGAWGKSKMRIVVPNPALKFRDEWQPLLKEAQANAKLVQLKDGAGKPLAFPLMSTERARPVYLRDDNSRTMADLEAYARREMMERVRKSLSYQVTVYGHGQADGGGNFLPWAVDQVVDVQDEVAGVQEPMWVLSRTFSKSRSSGTTTKLELIRLYSLEV